MNSKSMAAIMTAASMALPAASFAAVPQVSGVTMTQATSSRLVTIEYTLADAPAVVTLDVQTNATAGATADDPGWASIGGVAVCNAEGDVWKQVATGTRTITWRPDLSWPDHKIADGGARAVVTAWSLDNTPDYMVVDLTATGGAGTQRYYPGVDFLPGAQLGQTGAITNNPIYKTTTIVMRKIMAKGVTWTMGSTSLETLRSANETAHQVTLTNNYYMGVFEVTQSQWGLVSSVNPYPWFTNVADCAMRPVECVCFNMFRSAQNNTDNPNYYWPNDPNPSSFLGELRTKTGIDFDLPSEAQWEFAARAGNGNTKWGDGSAILNAGTDANLDLLERYQRNGGQVLSNYSYFDPDRSCGAMNGTAIVGSYAPNAWGLYDMLGNVSEWCLDWYEEDITSYGGKVNIDPATPANTLSGGPGGNRVLRGGRWDQPAGKCRPAYRMSTPVNNRWRNLGLRVCCTAGLQ